MEEVNATHFNVGGQIDESWNENLWSPDENVIEFQRAFIMRCSLPLHNSATNPTLKWIRKKFAAKFV